MERTAEYWNSRYQENNIPWDICQVSPAIKKIIEGLDKNTSVLVPGAGHAHEAIYMHRAGFKNVFVCDWAEASFRYLRENTEGFPESHLLCGDFFLLEGSYDLILEQTFFCAIDPSKRTDYLLTAKRLLKDGGMVAGLLFASHFPKQGPPFGGTKEEYLDLFKPHFDILSMELAQNSISPRLGNELLFKMKKK